MNPPDPVHGGLSSSTAPPSSHDAAPTAGSGAPRRNSVRHMLRQQREVEEKRKFGLAPLEVDAVTHTEISPNVPQSISRAPWYYGAAGPTLEHQRKHDGHRDDVLQDHVERAVTTGQATKFVPGACQNCGSRTHKTSQCVRVKRRVGAVYNNQVTGKDVALVASASGSSPSSSEPTYEQKRDRFAGDIKVDLFDLYRTKDEETSNVVGAKRSLAGPNAEEEKANSGSGDGTETKRRRLAHDVFREQTAQHGGVEVKELPKYLQNLDAMIDGTIYFDPKTGSMRGNPNTQDPTRLFQGDMACAQTGGHDDYLEIQHRFITGESKSFVDFDYDDELRQRRVREAAERQAQTDKSTRVETAHELLVRSLYGDVTPTSTTNSIADAKRAALKSLASTSAPATAASSDAAPNMETMRTAQLAVDWSLCVEKGAGQRHGHVSTYGSLLDLKAGEWGYSCCHQLKQDAPSCVMEDSAEDDA